MSLAVDSPTFNTQAKFIATAPASDSRLQNGSAMVGSCDLPAPPLARQESLRGDSEPSLK